MAGSPPPGTLHMSVPTYNIFICLALQLMDALHPGVVPIKKVDFNAKNEYDMINNYKVSLVAWRVWYGIMFLHMG